MVFYEGACFNSIYSSYSINVGFFIIPASDDLKENIMKESANFIKWVAHNKDRVPIILTKP